MENEHSSYSAKGGSSGGSVAGDFVHKEGSARGYYASGAPSVRPDGSTTLGTSDDGRLWVDSDTNELYVWSGTAWVAAGRTPPVGTVYFQLAGKTAPASLYGGTWTDVSATYAGCFFRAAGGDASAFASGNQAANLSAHTHTGPLHTHTMNHYHPVGLTSLYHPASGTYQANVTYDSFASEAISIRIVQNYAGSTGAEGTGATGSTGSGTDNRPINQTIKVWERTA